MIIKRLEKEPENESLEDIYLFLKRRGAKSDWRQ
jgi:hypothetical protein